jgi:membrane associated rhomboid family serine protease
VRPIFFNYLAYKRSNKLMDCCQMTDNEVLKPDVEIPTREPAINIPFSVLALIALCLCIHAIRTYVLSPTSDNEVLYYGAFIPLRYAAVDTGWTIEAFTSTLSYSFLHANFGHVSNNVLWLVVFGSPLARTLGGMRFLMFWALAAIIAAGFHYASYMMDPSPMIGASGAVSGMMGAAARFGFRMSRSAGGNSFVPHVPALTDALRNRSVLMFLGVYLVTNFLVGYSGFTPGGNGASIAWQAHVGGLVAGFFLIPLFLPRRSGLS